MAQPEVTATDVERPAPKQQPRTLPLIAARMAASVITVTIPLYLARKLAMEEYGSYKQAFLLCAPLLSVLPMGMVQSLYFFVPRAEKPRPVFLQTQAFNLFVGLLGAVGLALAMPFAAAKFSNPELLTFRWELSLYVFFFLGSICLEPTLTTQGKTGASAGVYVTSELVKSVALLAPVLLGYGLRGALAGMAAFMALRFIVTMTLMIRTKGPMPSWKDFRGQLAYAVPFGAAMMLNVPQQVAHQYAVSLAVTPALFAAYAAGCFQLPLVDLLYQPTSEVLMVRVGQLEKEGKLSQAVTLFRDATARLSLFFIPLCGFLVASAPAIVRTLFGDRFDAAIPIFRISVMGVALASMPMDGLLRARNQTRYLFIAYLAKAIVTVPLLLVLVPRFGMIGGICSWLAAEVFGKAFLFARIPKALSEPGRTVTIADALPLAHLARIAGGTAVGVIAVVAAGPFLRVWTHAAAARTGAMLYASLEGLLFAGAILALFQLLGLKPLQTVKVAFVRR